MAHDQSSAKCFVFTYKEGLLSRVGHDLKLRCTRFSVDLGEEAVTATFQADAFEVVSAMKDGRESPTPVPDKDKRQILENMNKAVLHPQRYPEIRFVSTSMTRDKQSLKVMGDLTVHGTTRAIQATARHVAGEWIAEVDLNTPDFGIPPFSALMGTLKVKPRIKVRLVVPAR